MVEKYKGHSFLAWYLYALQKIGITEPQSYFKDKYNTDFASMDLEREKEMKNDPMFKSFKEQ